MAKPDLDFLLHELALGLTEAGLPLPAEGLQLSHRLDRDLALDSMQLMRVARRLEAQHGYVYAVADWVAEQDESIQADWRVGALLQWIQGQLPQE